MSCGSNPSPSTTSQCATSCSTSGLDYLALRFLDGGYSVKAMHRLIMKSATYQHAGFIAYTLNDTYEGQVMTPYHHEAIAKALLRHTGLAA